MRYPYMWEFVAPKVAYLVASEFIDFHAPTIEEQMQMLKMKTRDRNAYARAAFELVRDEIGPATQDGVGELRADAVLAGGSGSSFGRCHLLCALLRANYIPAGLGYRRMMLESQGETAYALTGFAMMFLKGFGWFGVDPGIDSDAEAGGFEPPYTLLTPMQDERQTQTFRHCFDAPITCVVQCYRDASGTPDAIQLNRRGECLL